VLTENQFVSWIEASTAMFDILEGRDEFYELARKWVEEWFSSGTFTISQKDTEIIEDLVKGFNYDAFRNFRDPIERDENKWKNLVAKADAQFKTFRKECFKPGSYGEVGFAIALFLFTWNFQRFKEYFKRRRSLQLKAYFEGLGAFLEGKKNLLNDFATKRLISGQIQEETAKQIFQELNTELVNLGIGANEPIGTVKLLHVFAPYYFPLLDNKIAQATELLHERQSLTKEHYIKWMNALKGWLTNFDGVVGTLESKFNSSILKLVDEGLYLMSSVRLERRVEKLGLKVD